MNPVKNWLCVALASWPMTVARAQPDAASPSDPIAELRAIAAQATPKPVPDAPTPAGVQPESLAIISPDSEIYPLATRSLDDTLGAIGATTPTIQGADAPSPEDAERIDELIQLAAERSAAEDLPGEIDALQRAAAIDPARTELWTRLGDVRMRAREPASALRAYARAVDLGTTAPGALLIVARATELRGDLSGATSLFAQALRSAESSDDALAPAWRTLAMAGLGSALSESGSIRAGAEAFERALDALETIDMPTTIEHDPGVAAQLVELSRRRGELWTRIGDAHIRLGDESTAYDAYTAALSSPLLDPSEAEQRRLFAAMRSGRDAEAALTLLESVRRAGGRVNARQIETLRRLAAADGRSIAPAIERALRALREELGEPISASVESSLIRAMAAVATHDEAESILLTWLERRPRDLPGVRAYLSLGRTRGDVVARLERLVGADGMGAAGAVAELEPAGHDPSDVMARFHGPASPEARLVKAALALEIANPEIALSATADINDADAELAPGSLLLAARAAVRSGAWDRARDLIELIDPNRGDSWRLARALALRSAQRFPEALEAIRPLLDVAGAEPSLIGPLLIGAELALGAGQNDLAQQWLEQATLADPTDPRAYQALVRLYLPDGPLATEAGLRDTVRQLRRADPSNPTLRYLNAQDLLARGQVRRAESALAQLVDAGERSEELFASLIEAWLRLGELDDGRSVERAEAWLRAHIEREPRDTLLAATLARLLTRNDRPLEAEAFLADRLEIRFDRTLAQLRESLLRDVLDRRDEANELLFRRLQAGPRGLDEGIDLTTLLMTRHRYADAARELRRALPPGVELTSRQSQALSSLLTQSVRAALQDEASDELIASTDDFLQLFADQDREVGSAMRFNHVRVMAKRPERTVAELVDAAEQGAAIDAARAPTHRTNVTQALYAAGRDRDAIEAATRLSDLHPDNDELLMQRYFAHLRAASVEETVAFITEELTEPQAIRIAKQYSIAPGAVDDDTDRRTRLIFMAGNESHALPELEPLSRALYRVTLERDPEHGMAANNLGYALLESGDLEGAEPLLELAARLEPNSSSVLDSIGWLRYRQGRFADFAGRDGRAKLGAKAWLQRARRAADGSQNAVLLDHLGDAHYRLDERDQARLRWVEARELIRTQISRARQNGRTGVIAQLDDLDTRLEAKLEAVEGDEPVAVAPIAGEPGWPPEPEEPQ